MSLLADVKELSTSVRNSVLDFLSSYKRIRWKTVSFIIPTTPVPSHRPRISGYRFYVPGAAKNANFFNKEVLPTLDGLFISTPCKFKVDIYMPIPTSMTQTQKFLAERGFIRPWGNIGDVDNFDKAVFDMMTHNEKRGKQGILLDDRLIVESHTNKYYSNNPRYEVTITYMDKIPKSIIKTMRLDK